MDPLKIAIAAAMLLPAAPAHAGPLDRWRSAIAEASLRFGIPIAWIERVMRAESGGMTTRDGRPITSPAGAMGLMQLMPRTWADMRARLGLGANPYDPHDNILAGTLYLRLMYDRFGYPGVFAAYNAGPGRYADYLAGRARLPRETRIYVAAVAGPATSFDGQRAPPPDPIFLVRHDRSRRVADTPASLFVSLTASAKAFE